MIYFMSEKIKERHNKMTHDMYEEKEHYKMYKSGDHWVTAKIATIAGVALFSTAILGVGNQASADTVSSATASTAQVASSSAANSQQKTSSTAATPTEKSVSATGSSQSGIDVTVPHQNVDDAVKKAEQTGVDVKQDPTQHQSTTADKSQAAQDSIKKDYQSQVDNLNSATQKQEQVNAAKGTANDHSAVDDAVKKAQQAGVNVSKDADKKVSGSVDDAQKVQSQIKNDYNSQVNNINDAINKQHNVDAAKGTANDHGAVDDAVKKAQQAGVNVSKDSDKTFSGSADDAQKVQSQIKGDYNSQVNDIENAINQQKQYDEAYSKAMDEYNKALDDYNKRKDEYDKAMADLNQNGVAANGVDLTTIKQQLSIGKEPNATMKILSMGNGVTQNTIDGHTAYNNPNGLDSKTTTTFKWGNTAYNGDIAKVEYDNLTAANYNGHKISKIVATYSNATPTDKDLNPTNDPKWPGNPQLTIYSDPTDGFWYNRLAGVTVEYQFYDENGNLINFDKNNAWLTIASLNHQNDGHNENTVEKATLDSNGTVNQIKGSSVTVHNGKTLYADNVNTDKNGNSSWDVTGGPAAYYGAGLFNVNGNNIKITYNTTLENGSAPTASATWVTLQTTIPTIPSPAGNPPVPPKKQQASVSYHYDVANVSPAQVNYHYDVADLPNASASYHYDDLSVTPTEVKDVQAGSSSSKGESINGKEVVKGEDETFTLTSSPLPSNRTDDVKSLTYTDVLDKNVEYKGFNAIDANGKDVSNQFTVKQDGQTITISANEDYVKQFNADKSKEATLPTIYLHTVALNSAVSIPNDYVITINGNKWTSNKVEIHTPGSPNPVKNVDDNKGNDIDGNFVENGQDVNFNLTFDLSKDKDVVLSKDVIAKGLDMSDTIDNRLDVNTNGIKITDEKGKELNKDLFNITNKDNTVTVAVKDPQAFLNNYGGQKLNIFIPTKTKQDISGTINNTTVENHFGDKQKSNMVSVYIPKPTKDVAAGTVQGIGSVSINGKNVVQGQDITFELPTTNLPAGRKEDVKKYQVVDKLDPNFDYKSFGAFLDGKDVSSEFTPTLTKDSDGSWTLTLTASQALVDQMNAHKDKEFVIPTVNIYGSALKGGTTIKNKWTEVLNNKSWVSNEVTVNTEKPGTPVKTVVNADGQDANNGNVARGDALIYHVAMDLTNQTKDTVLTPETVAKGLWISDKMPNGVTVNKEGIRVNSADGKDITNQFTITDENGQIKVAAKDPESIIRTYGGTKLDITIPTTVNDDFTGDITNTAEQNTFGVITESNPVVDHVPPMNPTKDVVVDLGNQNSLNGQTIALGSTFDYKLNSSTRSEDYTGKTTEWGMQDHLDTKHDEFTGQWQVIADHPFVLKDGTTIKAGSDISKYFTMTYNTQTGEFDVEANQDFLDIMNLPANKKTKQGWSVFVQCKRIAPGTAYNTFSETYNGRVKKSNTVKTTTPEPKKPETPKKAETPKRPATPVPAKTTPTQPAKPAQAVAKVQPKATPAAPVLATPAPVKATPAPEKQAMPQTGEEENNEAALVGLAALGMVGMMGLGLRKKRYED